MRKLYKIFKRSAKLHLFAGARREHSIVLPLKFSRFYKLRKEIVSAKTNRGNMVFYFLLDVQANLPENSPSLICPNRCANQLHLKCLEYLGCITLIATQMVLTHNILEIQPYPVEMEYG